MKRNGILLNKKYRILLISTLAMTASTYLSSILDGIMVGRILGTVQLYAINLTTCIVFLRSIPIALFTFGGNTLSVTHKSERDQSSADAVFTLSFWSGVLSTVILSVIGIALMVPTTRVLVQGKEELAGYNGLSSAAVGADAAGGRCQPDGCLCKDRRIAQACHRAADCLKPG